MIYSSHLENNHQYLVLKNKPLISEKQFKKLFYLGH